VEVEVKAVKEEVVEAVVEEQEIVEEGESYLE